LKSLVNYETSGRPNGPWSTQDGGVKLRSYFDRPFVKNR
jgi:hypothetical protein